MKKTLLAFLLLVSACASPPEHSPTAMTLAPCPLEIGALINPACITVQDSVLLLTKPASLERGFNFTYHGQQFSAVAQAGRFTFIQANAPAFRTPEGIHMGTSLAELGIAPASTTPLTGMATIYQLPSGWVCAFAPLERVTLASRVLYLYKTAEQYELRQTPTRLGAH